MLVDFLFVYKCFVMIVIFIGCIIFSGEMLIVIDGEKKMKRNVLEEEIFDIL